jgi:hypothetical protein
MQQPVDLLDAEEDRLAHGRQWLGLAVAEPIASTGRSDQCTASRFTSEATASIAEPTSEASTVPEPVANQAMSTAAVVTEA